MFFIAGASTKMEKLDYRQNIVCSVCGRYGSYEGFVEYTNVSFFFIPIFRLNKKYHIKTSCCNSVYAIHKDIGKRMENNENIDLASENLQLIRKEYDYSAKKCPSCGFKTQEDFSYCPKCSTPLE